MSVVKTQASISLALVSDGKTGPQGPAGKDITSYAKGTVLPSTVAAANSQFWLLNSSGQCTAVYVSDGSKWVATPISASLIVAATFKGMNFEGVSFTGSEFKTTYTNVANTVGDDGTKFTGTGLLSGPQLVFNSKTNESTPQTVRTAVAPEGFSAYAGSKAFGYFSAVGEMALGDANGNSGSLTAEMLQQMDNVGALLWSGAWGMMATTTCTPSKAISKCMRGWAILWSYGTTNAARNTDYNITYVPKWFATGHSGAGWITVLHTNSGGHDTQKYVYITDTTIKGNGNNGKKGQNADFVMREVREW